MASAPKAVAIDGSATLTMVASRMSRNIAATNAAATTTFCEGRVTALQSGAGPLPRGGHRSTLPTSGAFAVAWNDWGMGVRRRPAPPQVVAPQVPASVEGARAAEAVEDDDVLDVVRWTSSTALPAGGAADVSVTGARLQGVRFTGTTWEGMTLVDAVVTDCEFSGAELTGARWERVELRGCRMSGLVAPGLRARNVRFVGCKLDEAWLRSAAFDTCAFEDCELTGADLLGARLTRTRLVDCRLDGAEFGDTRGDEVAIHGSSLTGASGLAELRGLVIARDQVLPLAFPLLAAHGITVDDTYLDDTALDDPPAAGAQAP